MGNNKKSFMLKKLLISMLVLIIISISGASIERYRGVNLAGGEFGFGIYDHDYTYPKQSEVDYFMSKGMNVFRMPFRWENLQPELNGSLNMSELKLIDQFIGYATSKGAYVILDPHNYGAYIIRKEDRMEVMSLSLGDQEYKEKNNALRGIPARAANGSEKVYAAAIGSGSVSEAHFADFWGKLAKKYKDNDLVIFGLMNEPHSITATQWVKSVNTAIKAIRDANSSNLILVPGTNWTGAHSWDQEWGSNNSSQTSNAEVMLEVKDPGNNYAYDVHQYLDRDFSGNSEYCISSIVGSIQLKGFTEWLKKNHKRGFLSEFAGGRNKNCGFALDDILNHLDKNSDVWLGWTYWVAGPWWPEEYIFSIEPIDGKDRPQMDILSRHLAAK